MTQNTVTHLPIRLGRNSNNNKNFNYNRLYLLPLLLLVATSFMLGIEASGVPPSTTTSKNPLKEDSNEIKIVFSDLDGTLIHYPDPEDGTKEKTGLLLEFPKSSTGLVGVISAKTLSLVDEIRNQNNVKFVLVSGMRTSTLLQRLPYLPRADAYCSENGGRIFYPVESNIDDDKDETKRIIRSIDGNDDEEDIFWIHPKRYGHDGKTKQGGDPHRNRPFAIREDKAWRKKMTTAIGGDSFGSFSIQETFDDPASSSLPLNERDGLLWDFARDLIHKHDFVLDTKGYATCFRVNKKQQTSEPVVAKFKPSEISALLNQSPWKDKATIASSVNLSCVDFYPLCSGKKNWYVNEKWILLFLMKISCIHFVSHRYLALVVCIWHQNSSPMNANPISNRRLKLAMTMARKAMAMATKMIHHLPKRTLLRNMRYVCVTTTMI